MMVLVMNLLCCEDMHWWSAISLGNKYCMNWWSKSTSWFLNMQKKEKETQNFQKGEDESHRACSKLEDDGCAWRRMTKHHMHERCTTELEIGHCPTPPQFRQATKLSQACTGHVRLVFFFYCRHATCMSGKHIILGMEYLFHDG